MMSWYHVLVLSAVASHVFGLYHSLTASIPAATMFFAQAAALAALAGLAERVAAKDEGSKA